MIFDFIQINTFIEDLKIETKSSLQTKQFAFLEYKNGYKLFIQNKYIDVKISNSDIDEFVKRRNLKTIIYLKEKREKFYIADAYIFYFYKHLSKIPITIDDEALEKLKIKFGKTDLDEIKKEIKKNITIKINDENYYIISTNFDEQNLDSFILYGEGFGISIKKNLVGEEVEFVVSKLMNKQPQKGDNFILIKSDIDFESNLVSDRVVKDLEEIIQDENSYITVWERYLKEEIELVSEKAKEIGTLNIKNIIPTDKENMCEIITETFPQKFKVGDSITFLDNNYVFEDLYEIIISSTKDEKEKELFFEIKDIKENSIFIEGDFKILNKFKDKKIGYSILGDKVRLKRIFDAREAILTGKSANPFLGLLLSDTEKIKDYIKPNITKIEPLSPYVKEKIFKNEPTLNQIKAIDVALNTPDIAIIQGPPGTGKTTVITAIIERLNEIKKENSKGQILITGYQHETVINLTQRLSVNSLPTIKFGIKDEDEIFRKYDSILEWADEIFQKIENNLKGFSKQKQIEEIKTLKEKYLLLPTKETIKTILDKIKRFGVDVEFEEFDLKEDVFDIKELKVVYAIRTTKESFLDDGKNRLEDLLNSKFIEILDDEEIKKLSQKDINLLDEYKKIRQKLILSLYPQPKYTKPKPDEKFLEFIDKVEDKLKEGKTKKDKLNKIIYDFAKTLKNNPFALEEMIKDYSFVFGATTQQSNRKEIYENKQENYYDAVIIDEAARVPPMDLLIPMIKAKNRIILVGDHRQLPHMVDETIIKEIQKDGDIEDEYIKKSMFEHLKERVKELEKIDGIKRTITLDNQYRTNPILGKFVSQNFYEKYNEGFNSPLPEEFFSHQLEGIANKACVFIDVPKNRCLEVSEQSKSRECEATTIIEYLKKWITSENDKNLSYGIITFYKKQVEIINKLIKNELYEYKSKIRVGSVDAFQGMEFDVVFLSVVRSKAEYTKKVNSDFGFLVSKNRLCVSMSRQKKVLVVVGDKSYFESEYAQKNVPELYNYIKLCEDKGVII